MWNDEVEDGENDKKEKMSYIDILFAEQDAFQLEQHMTTRTRIHTSHA